MRRLSLLVAGALAALVIAGSATAANSKRVVVASTNFPEQLVLANVYADVLQARGVPVRKRLNLGSREVVFPALQSGELDVLPEYSGALLGFLTNGKARAHKPKAVLAALHQQLPKGVVALKASPAQDKDALVVTGQTAKKYHLKTISDLKPVAGKLTLGGPPETRTRYAGVPGLKQVYGVQFDNFRSLDAGGPLTRSALQSGAVDVARMFSTQGVIADRGWVSLADDKHLVPAQNILPVVHEAALTPKIRKALNDVSARLTTHDLQRMNQRVSVQHDDPETVAGDWVEQHHLGKP